MFIEKGYFVPKNDVIQTKKIKIRTYENEKENNSHLALYFSAYNWL